MFGASTNIRETVFCLIALASVASSGIVGCDTLDCRLENDKNHENCPFAGDGVGTTVLQSNITADGPLTWSIVGNTDRYTMQQASKSDRRLMKYLYLGTPHSFQIQNADYHACTVTLFNITAALQVVPGYDDFPNFSCDTVLGGQCAKDLLAQARGRLDEALLPGGSSEYPCKTVADALMAESLPLSCNLPFGETSWGYIGTDGEQHPVALVHRCYL